MEDVEQDVLLALIDSLPRFRFDSAFKTYLYRLCRNKAIDFLRKKRRERALLDRLASQASPPPDPEEEAVVRRSHQRALSELLSLPEPERSLILLKDVQGLTVDEVSFIMGIPRGTVKSRLHRTRAKVVRRLKGERYG
jgi:RNA polymerase sigma-70 factor (ECF subfamily)